VPLKLDAERSQFEPSGMDAPDDGLKHRRLLVRYRSDSSFFQAGMTK
jgi:hypothetical protein